MTQIDAVSSARRDYRAILWDNDGVLVDTERWYHQATREVLVDVGIDVTDGLYFEHFLVNSGGITELGEQHGFGHAQIEALRLRRNARYEHFLAHEHLPIPGAEDVLRALRPHFAMGIVTSSRRDHFEMIHRRTGFLRFFDFALTQGDYTCSKPDPEPYLRAIERSGFSVDQCLAIEDAPRGLMAARAAGLDCWVLPTDLSRASAFPGATRIVGNIAEVAALLLGRPTPLAPAL
jgi:HAD superfamily hydrolase (TIGR01509 family)